MFRRVVLFATICLSGLLISSCGKNKSTAASSSSSGPKILHFSNHAEPQDLDPHTITGVPEHRLALTFFEGLVSEDPQLNIIPGVAEKWEVSDDKLTYTFHLRADAKWSNGDPLTSHDFVESYRRVLTPALASEYAYMLYNHVRGAKDFYDGKIKDFSQVGFKAPDDRTLQIVLAVPTPFLLHALNFYIWFPVHTPTLKKFGAFDQRRNSEWTRPENFVSNGPYVLKEWRLNQKIVATKSPHYWDRDKVKIDEIHFYPIELADTEERMFRTGQLHITGEVPLSKIPVYQREQSKALRIDLLNGVYFYRFNVARKPFDDVRVRRALAMSIDREALVKNVTLAGEQPAYHLVPPNLLGYNSRYRIKADVAEAKRLLAEAGYPEGRGFPKVELLYNTLEKHRIIAEALQQMWRRNLGIDITLYNQEWKVYLDSQHSKNFQFQRAGWNADYVDPHAFLDMWQTDGGNNNTNWGSPEYDRLLHAALAAPTTEARYEIYQQMEKIFLDDMPVMPIFFYTRARLVSPKVKHYFTTPLDNFPWKYADLEL